MVGGRQGRGLGLSAALTRCFRRSPLFLSGLFLMFFGVNSWAGVGGSVSGTIKDTSNALVANATVSATNVETGVQHQAATNGQGFYSFTNLPIGRYNITMQKAGFKPYQRTGVTVDADSAATVDAVLAVARDPRSLPSPKANSWLKRRVRR